MNDLQTLRDVDNIVAAIRTNQDARIAIVECTTRLENAKETPFTLVDRSAGTEAAAMDLIDNVSDFAARTAASLPTGDGSLSSSYRDAVLAVVQQTADALSQVKAAAQSDSLWSACYEALKTNLGNVRDVVVDTAGKAAAAAAPIAVPTILILLFIGYLYFRGKAAT